MVIQLNNPFLYKNNPFSMASSMGKTDKLASAKISSLFNNPYNNNEFTESSKTKSLQTTEFLKEFCVFANFESFEDDNPSDQQDGEIQEEISSAAEDLQAQTQDIKNQIYNLTKGDDISQLKNNLDSLESETVNNNVLAQESSAEEDLGAFEAILSIISELIETLADKGNVNNNNEDKDQEDEDVPVETPETGSKIEQAAEKALAWIQKNRKEVWEGLLKNIGMGDKAASRVFNKESGSGSSNDSQELEEVKDKIKVSVKDCGGNAAAMTNYSEVWIDDDQVNSSLDRIAGFCVHEFTHMAIGKGQNSKEEEMACEQVAEDFRDTEDIGQWSEDQEKSGLRKWVDACYNEKELTDKDLAKYINANYINK